LHNSTPSSTGDADSPAVTVVIPAYDCSGYISATLESVFAQTFQSFEVIVVNDGSKDTEELEEILASYQDRIVYLRQDNRGPSAARNLAIRHARGKYVAFLDSDDTWMPEYLATQIRFLEQTPAPDLVYADLLLVRDASAAGRTFMQECPSFGPATFESVLTGTCQIPTSGTVVRRQAVIEAGFFDEAFRRSEDYDLWLRIAHRGGGIAYHRTVLGRHRIRPGSLASQPELLCAAGAQVLVKLSRELNLSERLRPVLEKRLARARADLALARGKRLLLQGQFNEARKSLREAAAFHPRLKALVAGLQWMPRLTRAAWMGWRRLRPHR
jgi:glycosyltransferase involved in cell wall biosynthesis